MFIIAGLVVAFIICVIITDGNMGFAFVLLIGLVALTVFTQFSEEKEKKTERNPRDENLEQEIYNGLQRDWNNHKTEGNHFVPQEYVGYMEKNSRAWECWAKARTNEILVDKGYMGKNMDCTSKYDPVKRERVDQSSHAALFKVFNEYYIPLIEYYNKTGEVYYTVEKLPPVVAKKQMAEDAVLAGYELYPVNETKN